MRSTDLDPRFGAFDKRVSIDMVDRFHFDTPGGISASCHPVINRVGADKRFIVIVANLTVFIASCCGL